jgi:hypothetical protein
MDYRHQSLVHLHFMLGAEEVLEMVAQFLVEMVVVAPEGKTVVLRGSRDL